MLCVKPWKQRESDNWETKAFQYLAKPNMGALVGKSLAHYFLAFPWFILGLNKVGRESGSFPAWGLRDGICRAKWLPWNGRLISICPCRLEGEQPQHMPEVHQPLGHHTGSFLSCLEQLPLFSTPFCPPGSKLEVTLSEKPNSKGGFGALH